MEGEMGASARIAIALIVLAVLLSVIFVILGFTRGATNEGIIAVQNSTDAMQVSQFDDYDQKPLTGAQVSSAIKLMEGRAIACVVANIKQNVTATGYRDTEGSSILKNDGSEIAWVGTNYGSLLQGCTTKTKNTWLTSSTEVANHIQFSETPNTEESILALSNTAGKIYRAPDMSHYVANLNLNADGSVPSNNEIRKIRQSGGEFFIRGTSKYMARLILDTTGTIVGLCFIQTS